MACEYSGVTREALRAIGFDAISCDLLPSDDNSPNHYQGDVIPLLDYQWDFILAHPTCTYLTNSGVRWLHSDPSRWEKMREGAEFFSKFLKANSPFIAVENPVMHKYAIEIIGRKQNCSSQPHEHGDPFTKRTCFWTLNLPKLLPSDPLDRPPEGWNDMVHKAPPGPDRWKVRSTTFPGMGKAVADQWGRIALAFWALRNQTLLGV